LQPGRFFCGWHGSRNWHAQSVAAQNKFGQPKTVVHVVVYKWKSTTSQNDKDQALAGIKSMAAKIPGIKNIWLKTQRNQIRDFDGVYAIEFASPEAAADYAESPLHETWRKNGKSCEKIACRSRCRIRRCGYSATESPG